VSGNSVMYDDVTCVLSAFSV